MRATAAALVHTEGEANTSPARRTWNARVSDERTTSLVARDADAFLHQSLSSPCLTAIAKAEGIWIEDTAGRRYMDFHGNSVHHIGYGHPRLKQAIKAQIDDLCFAPRRFTCEPAVELAEILGRLAPGDLGKVLFTTGGSDAIEVALKLARAATGRFKTSFFLGCLPWCGVWCVERRRRGHLPLGYRRAVVARRRTCRALGQPSLRLWPGHARSFCPRLRQHDLLCARPRRRFCRAGRRAHAGNAQSAGAGLLETGTRGLRSARNPADFRRNSDGPRQDRAFFRLRA